LGTMDTRPNYIEVMVVGFFFLFSSLDEHI
jgi:hypothetical protein